MSKETDEGPILELGPRDELNEKNSGDDSTSSRPYRKSHQQSDQLLIGTVIIGQVASVIFIAFFYSKIYSVSPYGSSAFVSCLLCGFSQGLLQLIVHRRFHPMSLLKYYCWGIVNGLWTKWWTDSLTGTVERVPLRILCDQTIGNPTNLLIFLTFISYWDGRDIEKYFHQTYFKMLKTSYIIWPIASTIQFYFLDTRYLVPFNSLVNVFWTVILGIITG